jgi:hypothetical protein
MQMLVKSLASSLPGLANLGCIFLLVFFIFAVLSMSLFGNMCVEGESGLPGLGAVRCFLGDGVLGAHANFRHFGEAAASLLRTQTGDAWSEIMLVISTGPVDLTREITTLEWMTLSGLLGYNPRDLDVHDPRYDSKLVSAEGGRMALAKIKMARMALPVLFQKTNPAMNKHVHIVMKRTLQILTFLSSQGCLTDENVLELESEGLMDCSQVDPNPTGIPVTGASIRASAAILLP